MRAFFKILFFSLALIPGMAAAAPAQKAYFAGGCFWCMTPPFEKLKGVLKVTAGYADGQGTGATYDDYAEKGFTETVEITYDPAMIDYPELLGVYWKQINPTDPEGQFVDRGPQYRSAIYYLNEKQRAQAEQSKKVLDKSGLYDKPIVTPVKKFTNFYPAEDYHQDFYKKNPLHYEMYHAASGRDSYLDGIWGKGKH
ncbi:MAG TPA: peptide-methionine (S)-S-oxide reductase MsrA [bacterium]|nr:peptide-methionine (S)-S-oxide reductase MsrA [bacterium]